MKKFTCILFFMISGIVVQAYPNASKPSLETAKVTTVPDEEKQALIDLYNATGGENWIDNTNWLSDRPVSEWNGVEVEDGHVTVLSLYRNGLIGTLPESMKNLNYLTGLYAFSNKLSGVLIDLSEITSLRSLTLYDNNYSFADLETNYESLSKINFSILSPQKSIGTDEIIEGVMGETYTFQAPAVEGENVTYQWYILKKGGPDINSSEIIPNETTTELVISNITENELDTYVCLATSVTLPDVEVWSPTFELTGPVSQKETDALVALWVATNGPNWTYYNWSLNEPVRNWSGITVSGNKVVAIDLTGNNLTGTLPPEIGDLEHLQFIEFYANSIGGTLPTEIGNLTELRSASFSANNFTGELPDSFKNLTKLNSLWMNANKFSGTVPESLTDFEDLHHIVISYNNFSGKLPDFSTLPKLEYLSISNNSFLASDFADQYEYYKTLPVSWSSSWTYSPQYALIEPGYQEALMGSDITLTIPGTESSRRAATYQWFKDGNSIDGAINSSYLITDAQYVDSGAYNYEVYDTEIEGYVLIGEITTVEVKETLSISEVLDHSISFYPNPVSNNQINIQNNTNINIQSIRFYNVLGKEVKHVLRPSLLLNISDLSSGMYIMKVNTDQGELSKKIIKL